MYGVIFDFLREYVIERHGGKDTWQALLDDNRCQPWRAKRRLVNPGSREAALLTRRA